jgi:hypothetical protein
MSEKGDDSRFGIWKQAPGCECGSNPDCPRCVEWNTPTPEVKRPPGRPRKPPASVAPEQLGPYTEKARALLDDEPEFIKWLNERRTVAIVALGETLADPKLFLEVTDDLLKELKEIAEAGKRAKKR